MIIKPSLKWKGSYSLCYTVMMTKGSTIYCQRMALRFFEASTISNTLRRHKWYSELMHKIVISRAVGIQMLT